MGCFLGFPIPPPITIPAAPHAGPQPPISSEIVLLIFLFLLLLLLLVLDLFLVTVLLVEGVEEVKDGGDGHVRR